MKELSEAELDALIDQATVDCYNEDEELAGFTVMIEDNLAMPVRDDDPRRHSDLETD